MECRKVGLYAGTGVMVAVVIIAGVFLVGVQPFGLVRATGTLVVLLTDAPVQLSNLTITVDGLSVLNETHTVELAFVGESSVVTFDLLSLSGRMLLLSQVGDFPVGEYTKLRFHLQNPAIANYTDRQGAVHTNVEVTVPPEHLDVTVAFTVEADETTIVLVDMTVDDGAAVSATHYLRPVLKAMVIEEAPASAE